MTVTSAFRPLMVWVLLLISAFGQSAAAESQGHKTILVTRTGWHSGIIIARRDLPEGAIPETADFPDAAYFEFGWGSAEYYPLLQKSIATMIGGVIPGPAVIHLIGLPKHPRELFPDHETVAFQVTDEEFRRLIAYLGASFDRDGAARIKPSARGHHDFSGFYPATGTFHLLNTCNTWTARGLRAAGIEVRASGLLHAEELMTQLRALARSSSVESGK
jgi:uncharacterized protein (TIGR02117 family)